MKRAAGKRPIITLTTDFGGKDYFTAAMKGVILKIHPEALLVDLSHEIEPYRIDQAAYVLQAGYPYFPDGSIHVVVVDPGVGGDRRAILVEAGGAFFVGPDNGVFSYIYARYPSVRVIQITAKKYFLRPDGWEGIGPTFHGRDVFAPVAAWLAKGTAPNKFGAEIHDPAVLPISRPRLIRGEAVEGNVVYIDRYGNLTSNLTHSDLKNLLPADRPEAFQVEIAGCLLPLKSFYSEVPSGQPAALINSSGYLEVFIHLESAQKRFQASVGDPLHLTLIPGFGSSSKREG